MIWAKDMQVPAAGIFRQMGTILLMRPAPLVLLVMSIFYLWVYIRLPAPVFSHVSEVPVEALMSREGI
jgi:hypothetical protein